MKRRLFNYIEKNKQKYLEEIFELLRIPSISNDKVNILTAANCLKKIMVKSGLKTKIFSTGGNPIVYGERINKNNAPTILFYGHYDVKSPDPLDLWRSKPFEPVIKNGKIYARGAADDKCQLYIGIKGFEAYLKINKDFPINFKCIFEGEEEIQSPNLAKFVSENKELLKSDLLIASDSYIHEDGIPVVYLGNKGILYIEITVVCAKKDFHSMRAPAVPNAIWRLINLLNILKGEDGIIKIDGFYENVKNLSDFEIESVKKIPYNEKAILEEIGIKKFIKNRTENNYYYNLVFEPTCNICGIYGGFIGKGSKTILPHKATAKIGMRLVPNQDPEEILKKLKNHLKKYGYSDAKIKVLGMSYPIRCTISTYVTLIKEAIEEVWGITPLMYPNTPGTAPSYIFTRYLNLYTILIPFALTDENSHAPNENFPVDSITKGIKTIANIIDKLVLLK